jgi:hypothetical protein
MENRMHQFLFLCLIGPILALASCAQNFENQKDKGIAAARGPLAMTQTHDGKWVITDSQKTPLYEVFFYDNGPDYPSEGLIRVLKNGKIGYADATTFALVIEPQFDCAFPFEGGKAKVSKQCQTLKDGEHSTWTSDHWKYVDKQGNF